MARPTELKGLSAQTPLAEAARRIAVARLADTRGFAALVRRAPEQEAVHDLRVSTRRLRAALGLCGDGLRKSEREAKRLQDALGALRDLQLQLGWLGEALLQAPRRGGARDALAQLIAQRERAAGVAERKLSAALDRWDEAQPRLLAALEQVDRKGKLGGHRVRDRLRHRLEQVQDRMREARRSLEPSIAHAVRIAVKKLRYDVELAAPALPAAAAVLLEELPPLQALLGELHDADVRLEFLQREGRRPDLRDALGPLRVGELAKRGRCAHELALQLARYRDESLPRRFRALIG